MTSSVMLFNDIMDDVIHSLKSYIKGSDRFYGTQQHDYTVVYIDLVVELCTDPKVIIYYFPLLVNLFDLIHLYWNAYYMMVLNVLS